MKALLALPIAILAAVFACHAHAGSLSWASSQSTLEAALTILSQPPDPVSEPQEEAPGGGPTTDPLLDDEDATDSVLQVHSLTATMANPGDISAGDISVTPNAINVLQETSVPEPASHALLALGLLAIAFASRRKRAVRKS